MAETRKHPSHARQGARRGVGFALGVGAVVTVASVLRDGARQTLKQTMKGTLRGQEALAELGEQLRDVYVEAQSEHVAEAPEATA